MPPAVVPAPSSARRSSAPAPSWLVRVWAGGGAVRAAPVRRTLPARTPDGRRHWSAGCRRRPRPAGVAPRHTGPAPGDGVPRHAPVPKAGAPRPTRRCRRRARRCCAAPRPGGRGPGSGMAGGVSSAQQLTAILPAPQPGDAAEGRPIGDAQCRQPGIETRRRNRFWAARPNGFQIEWRLVRGGPPAPARSHIGRRRRPAPWRRSIVVQFHPVRPGRNRA